MESGRLYIFIWAPKLVLGLPEQFYKYITDKNEEFPLNNIIACWGEYYCIVFRRNIYRKNFKPIVHLTDVTTSRVEFHFQEKLEEVMKPEV